MGTRSRIAVANADGTFTSIYCHWDGYPEHNGRILHEHYGDEAKVQSLMALGNLSSLGPSLGEKHDFDADGTEDVCTAYGRDRGEQATGAATSADLAALKSLTKECGGEFLYVFDGTWKCAAGGLSAFGMPALRPPAALEDLGQVLRELGVEYVAQDQ